MIYVIRLFQIRNRNRSAFISTFQPDEKWCTIQRQERGYIHTDLLCQLQSPSQFLVLDFWDSITDFESALCKPEVRQLHKTTSRLAQSSLFIGSFSFPEKVQYVHPKAAAITCSKNSSFRKAGRSV